MASKTETAATNGATDGDTVNGTKRPVEEQPTPSETANPARKATAEWLRAFEAALTAKAVDDAASLFAETSFWRDFVAFTWNIATVENLDGVRDLLHAQLPHIDARAFRISEEPTTENGIPTAFFTFETQVGRGRGILRLQGDKAWILITSLEELKGFEEPLGPQRPKGVDHGSTVGRQSWAEKRDQELRDLGYSQQPYALVIGGGQGGIALGARLRQLSVPAIVIDKFPRPGDQWRSRYKSLCLHDPVWYDHMPYLPYPPTWPIFTPKDKMGAWLQMYVETMELVYWGSTEAKKATYDDTKKEWKVVVNRDGVEVTLRPKELVMATGMSGKPAIPSFPGAEHFRGDQHHSSKHPGPDAWKGKNAVIIGSNNSAHDICAALHEAGAARVTMVQRSPTLIVRSEPLLKHHLSALYSEEAVRNGVSTEKADLLFASIPSRLIPMLQEPPFSAVRKEDADFYAALERVGFQLDWGPDGGGLFPKYLSRGSGYYIDVGAAQLVIDGKIQLASGQVAGLTERAVRMQDGAELPADLVVYATGYRSMNGWAADLMGQAVADRVGKVWGYGLGTPKDPGHVEAHAPAGPVVPRRQPRAESVLQPAPGVATESADGRRSNTSVWDTCGTSY